MAEQAGDEVVFVGGTHVSDGASLAEALEAAEASARRARRQGLGEEEARVATVRGVIDAPCPLCASHGASIRRRQCPCSPRPASASASCALGYDTCATAGHGRGEGRCRPALWGRRLHVRYRAGLTRCAVPPPRVLACLCVRCFVGAQVWGLRRLLPHEYGGAEGAAPHQHHPAAAAAAPLVAVAAFPPERFDEAVDV
jgi:hypothetical protein